MREGGHAALKGTQELMELKHEVSVPGRGYGLCKDPEASRDEGSQAGLHPGGAHWNKPCVM